MEPTEAPVTGFCKVMHDNLNLHGLWWLAILIEIGIFLLLGLIYKLIIVNIRFFHYIAFTNIITLYANLSLWLWSIYLIVALAKCGIGTTIIPYIFYMPG